jgi:hypothetical protein
MSLAAATVTARVDLYEAAALAGRTTISMYERLALALVSADRPERLAAIRIAQASAPYATGAREAVPSCGWVAL